jgi:hypothetical protein
MNMKEKEDIEFVVSNIGAIGREGMRDVKSSNAQVNIDLVDIKEMKFTQEQIRNSIRQYLDKLPGLYTYKFGRSQQGLLWATTSNSASRVKIWQGLPILLT